MSVALAPNQAPADRPQAPNRLMLKGSQGFADWLGDTNASLCVSTYQAGKLMMIGCADDGRLSVFERTLSRCMGLTAEPDSVFVATQYVLWRLQNILPTGQTKDGYDALYVPQAGWVTGDIDIHDMAVDGEGSLVFVSTLFSCLATTSETHSFKPLWKPGFISALAPEDRCHLNGLALRDGRPAYVTAVARTDAAAGWRDMRESGGCVVDIETGEIVVDGLSMPHSPRWHDGKLWLHNSGSGEFGYVDLDAGKFEAVCFCPGYLRGLSFCGDFAVIGSSRPRPGAGFGGLPLDAALTQANIAAQCGLVVVDLAKGEPVHWLKIGGAVEELYDVAVITAVSRPMSIGFQSDDIRRIISIEE